MHWSRWRKHGDPSIKLRPGLPRDHAGTVVERIMAKVRKLPNGCWEFTGAKHSHGYGMVSVTDQVGKPRAKRAHKVLWEDRNGPVPHGRELDHFLFPENCIGPACCNPEHVRPATHRENSLRSDSPPAVNARRTHCHRGHPFSADNTYCRPHGGRECRTCMRDARRRREGKGVPNGV